MILSVIGDINEDMVRQLSNVIMNGHISDRTIIVNFDSRGGYIDSGIVIADLFTYLKSLGYHLVAINTGDVMSAATIPWLVCDERIWDPQYQFLIHNPYLENVSGTANDLIEQVSKLTEIETDLIDLYSSVSGYPSRKIEDIMENEEELSPEKLMDLKFITGLRDETLSIAGLK